MNSLKAENVVCPKPVFDSAELGALEAGEVPLGTAVVHEGRIVSRGFNRNINIANFHPTAHAKMIAVQKPAQSGVPVWPPKLPLSGEKKTIRPCIDRYRITD